MSPAELEHWIQTLWALLGLLLVLLAHIGVSLRGVTSSPPPGHQPFTASRAVLRMLLGLGLSVLAFWLVGYGLARGANPGGWFGSNGFWPLNPDPATSLELLNEALRASLCVAIVTSVLGMRVGGIRYVLCCLTVSGLVFALPSGWTVVDTRAAIDASGAGGGWLAGLGFVDAGRTTTVHALAALLGLAALTVLGGTPTTASVDPSARALGEHTPSTSLHFTIGTLLAWVGLIGLIPALMPGPGAGNDVGTGPGTALVNLCLGSLAATLTPALLGASRPDSDDPRPLCNAWLCGAITVSACATLATPLQATLIGALAGGSMLLAGRFLNDLELDDPGGIVPVHAVGGVLGTLSVGLPGIRADMGLTDFSAQLVGIVACGVYGLCAGGLLFKLLAMGRGKSADHQPTADTGWQT
ncbi:MAG: hypothetical protein KDK91_14760 [Gammaproteobacteria bacterium]|nr:hypothetical protein [Gammaproteobacteria bacterium]